MLMRLLEGTTVTSRTLSEARRWLSGGLGAAVVEWSAMNGRMGGSSARSRAATALLVAAIVAVALNQRPAVVTVSPLLGQLRADTGLSAALGGLLTTVPVLCFGAFAPLAPRLARRIGLESAVALSLVLLAAGIALRLLSPLALLYAGSL